MTAVVVYLALSLELVALYFVSLVLNGSRESVFTMAAMTLTVFGVLIYEVRRPVEK